MAWSFTSGNWVHFERAITLQNGDWSFCFLVRLPGSLPSADFKLYEGYGDGTGVWNNLTVRGTSSGFGGALVLDLTDDDNNPWLQGGSGGGVFSGTGWQSIALVRRSGTVHVYRNGVSVRTFSATNFNACSFLEWAFPFWDGTTTPLEFAEFAAWETYALTTGELEDLAALDAPTFFDPDHYLKMDSFTVSGYDITNDGGTIATHPSMTYPTELIQRLISGSASAAGGIKRKTGKRLGGGVGLVGSIRRRVKRAIVGAVTLAGVAKKKIRKVLLGALASVGSIDGELLSQTIQMLLTGAVTSAGAARKKASRKFTATAATIGGARKKTKRKITATAALAGTAFKKIKRIATGVVAGAGAVAGELIQDVVGAVSGAITASGGLVKKVYKRASGAASLGGVVGSKFQAWVSLATDTFTDTNGIDLSSRISDSGHAWVKRTQMGSHVFTVQGNKCQFTGDGNSLDGYHLDLEPKSDDYFIQVTGRTSHNSTTNDRLKLIFRADPNPATRTLYYVDFRAGASPPAGLAVLVRVNNNGTPVVLGTGDITFNANTDYLLRVHTRIDGGDVVIDVYFDGVLVRSLTDTSGSRITSRGRIGIGASTGGAGRTVLYDNFTAEFYGPLSKKILSGLIGGVGTAKKKTKKIFTGAITTAGDLVGGIIQIFRAFLEGSVSSSGLVERSMTLRRSIQGAVTSAGSAIKKTTRRVVGVIGAAGSLAHSGAIAILRFALDDVSPAVDGTVKYLVELRQGSMPSGPLNDGDLYRRALKRAPEFTKTTGSAAGGVSGLSSVKLLFSNLDGFFNGRDLMGLFVRVSRVFASQVVEFKGVITEWVHGSDVEVTSEDREAIVFSDQLPKRVITKELCLNLPDRDAGKVFKVMHGLVTKIPLRLIGVDLVNRNWDYELGEGVGRFGFWQNVFTVYRKDAALGDIQGTVSSASGSSITLEVGDGRPPGFYKDWWIQILDPSTLAVLDEKHVTAHNSERVVVLASAPAVSASGKKYRIKQWRFFNGSQSDNYPGIAFVRLKMRLGTDSSLDELFADGDSLPAANIVRETEDWLTNETWGLGLEIDQAAFDALAENEELAAIKTGWGVMAKTDASAIIEPLLAVRNMGLKKEGVELSIEADMPKTVAGVFGYGDGYYDNILSIDSGGIQHRHIRDRIKNLTIQYRRNYKETNTYLGTQTAEVHSAGIDETKPVPIFYDNESANRYLYYSIKKLISESRRLTVTVGEEGEAIQRRDRITIKIPHLGINSDWLVREIRRQNGKYVFTCNPYDGTMYEWEQLGSYPQLPTNIILPDLEKTPPSPVSALNVTGGARISETGDRVGFLNISWTPPNDGNYLDSEVSVKLTVDGLSAYRSRGFGFNSLRIDGVEANKNYDVLVESRNQYGLKGVLGTERIGTATGTATAAPNKPATPTPDRSGRSWVFRVAPNPSAQKVAYYVWEVANTSDVLQETYDKAGTQVSFSRGAQTSGAYKARVKAVNIYEQESPWSNYSTAPSMEQWGAGHVADNAINENKRIPVYSTTRSRTGLSIVAGGNAVWIDTITHNLGRQVVASVETTSGMLSGPLVVVVSFSAIDNNTLSIRTTVYNYGGTTQSGQSYSHVVKYW